MHKSQYDIQHIHDDTLLFQHLSRNATLVTSNNRLANFLENQYNVYQHQQLQHTVWPKPRIFSYQSWMINLWQRYSTSAPQHVPCLLNEWQVHCIWHAIINKATINKDGQHNLFNLNGIIDAVKNAWKVCNDYRVPLTQTEFNLNIDTAAFLNWAKAYQSYLQEHHLIDLSQILQQLFQPDHSSVFNDMESLIICGFDEITPQFMQGLEYFQQYHGNIYDYQQQISGTIEKRAFNNNEHEFNHCISWIKQQRSLGLRIACVIPDLTLRRAIIERTLLSHFNAEDINISIGKSFNDYAIIGSALKLLALKFSPLNAGDITHLLLSPYLGGQASEFYKRCELDKKFNDYRINEVTVTEFARYLIDHQLSLAENFKEYLAHDCSGKRRLNEWSKIFTELLQHLQWPGHRTLNSLEYQLYQRWLKMLVEYPAAEDIVGEIDYKTAVHLLQQIAQAIIFQPKAQQNNINVLGLLEAAGLQFDAMWIMGLNNKVMPAAAKPNPFIPYHLQQQLNLPHASSAKELTFSKQLMQRLSTGAKNIIMSYAKLKDTFSTLPSPVLELFAGELQDIAELPEAAQDSLLETVADDYIIPVVDPNTITGGTFILRDQALCPFKAFAHHRLKVIPWNKLSVGLNDQERGLIVHRLLEHFWSATKTREQLLQYSVAELDHAINGAIEFALAPYIAQRPDIMNRLYSNIEAQRLAVLLREWLEVEKQRANFTVLLQETWQTLTLGELTLKLRVDRIDQLADGNKIVIDYKTGQPNINDWFTEYLSEPQLPSYAIADRDIKGLVYAQLKSPALMFKGVMASDEHIPGVKSLIDNWQQQCDKWQQQLTALAQQFIAGHALVAPMDAATCNYCNMQTLCRVYEK